MNWPVVAYFISSEIWIHVLYQWEDGEDLLFVSCKM